MNTGKKYYNLCKTTYLLNHVDTLITLFIIAMISKRWNVTFSSVDLKIILSHIE